MKTFGFLSLLALAAAAPVSNTASIRDRAIQNSIDSRNGLGGHSINTLHNRAIVTGSDLSSDEADILKRRLLDDALENEEAGADGASSTDGGSALSKRGLVAEDGASKRGDDDHAVNVKSKINVLADLLGLIGIKLDSDVKVGALKRSVLDLGLDLDNITAQLAGILGLKLDGFVKADAL